MSLFGAPAFAAGVKVTFDDPEIGRTFPDLQKKMDATWAYVRSTMGLNDEIEAPLIYISPFNRKVQNSGWNDFQQSWWTANPVIWEEYTRWTGGARDENVGPFPANFRAYQYVGTNKIQINPQVFFSGVQNDHLGNKKDFVGAGYYSAAHEMFHYALTQAGFTKTEIHHCLLTLPIEKNPGKKSLIEAAAEHLVGEKISGMMVLQSARGEAEARPCEKNRLSAENFAAAKMAAQAIGGFAIDEILKDSKVVYLGELHFDTAPKEYIAAKIFDLKKAGITHIALEMFNHDSQQLLDNYASHRATDSQIVEYLTDYWGHAPESYLRVLQAAKAAKIPVIALDRRPNIKAGSYVDHKAPRDDQYMAETIAKLIFESQKNRVLVLIGADHVDSKVDQPDYIQYQPGILRTQFNIESLAYKVVPLHTTTTVWRSEDPNKREPYRPGVPGWVKFKRYLPSLEPERQHLKELGLPSGEVFIPEQRDESGFDGKILIDAYNRDPQ